MSLKKTESSLVLILIPTLNEAGNISRQVEDAFRFAPHAHILVIDDDSQDGTPAIVQQLAAVHRGKLHLMERRGQKGLGRAYLDGMNWGLEAGYETFVEMDADGSHDAAHLPALLHHARHFDVVIGSRYIPGGSTVNWSHRRRFISRAGSLYARTILNMPFKDLTGGYNVWSRSALESIRLDLVKSEGYAFQIEMKYRSFLAGCKIMESPITFADRRVGQSKMSGSIVQEAILRVWNLRRIRIEKAA